MGIFDWKHWVVILIVVVLVFGTKKLKGFGSDLGESIKGFRKAMNDEEKNEPSTTTSKPLEEPSTIDVQAHKVEEPARKE